MNYTTYKVKAKDTLSKIAREHNVTIQAIMEANPGAIKDPNFIREGWVLKIPVPDPSDRVSERFEKVGKAFEAALEDVRNLPSVQALMELVGD